MISFAMVEEYMDRMLFGCLKVEEESTREASLKYPFSFTDKLKALVEFWTTRVDLRPLPLLKNVCDFSEKLSVIAGWRNAICHSRLVREVDSDGEPDFIFERYTRGDKTAGGIEFSVTRKEIRPEHIEGAKRYLLAAKVVLDVFLQKLAGSQENWWIPEWAPYSRETGFTPDETRFFTLSKGADRLCRSHSDWPRN